MQNDNLEGFTIKVVLWLPLCAWEGKRVDRRQRDEKGISHS